MCYIVEMRPENRLGLDYAKESQSFTKLPYSIIDVHSHINGEKAAVIYKRARELYGVSLTYSMTHLEQLELMRKIFGDSIQFIVTPNFNAVDKIHEYGKGYIERIKKFQKFGAKIVKFWTAPRIYDASPEPFVSNPFRLDSPLRQEAMQFAADEGMIFMVHVADPDTWFKTKYKNSEKYGTKKQQYDPLRDMLTRFKVPVIAAHMGGYSEDLDFLSTLLTDHSNLYLDCSATKWVVRELSKHDPQKRRDFFSEWKGRILFGSDIVTYDGHLQHVENAPEMLAKAASETEAFDLYASRYWALKKLFETDYSGESPIADPDLRLVEPDKYSELDAPKLVGCKLPDDVLAELYYGAANRLFAP